MRSVAAVNVNTESSRASTNSTAVRNPRNRPCHGLDQSSAKGVDQPTKSWPQSASATSAATYRTSVIRPGISPKP